ncbi:MAG: carbon-nitrogen hydrolase family protein [Planctomycetota bacterium]|nr:carbon-nitrogen hydrolase family protein [Planctomycetota bacterium]
MARPVTLGLLNVSLEITSLAQRRKDVLRMIADAGRAGCQIVVVPEFGDHHRTRESLKAHGKGIAAVRKTCSVSWKHPFLKQCAALAKKYKMVVIPDVFLFEDGRYYNSCEVIGPDGKKIGHYRKTHLAPGECDYFEPGDRIEPIETPFGKLGLLICYDINFPELTRCHEIQGADLLLWTTMRQAEIEEGQFRAILPARAIEHSLPLGVATYVTDAQLVGRKPMTSACWNALGQPVAGGWLQPGVVTAKVDLDDRALTRRRWGNPDWVDGAKYLRRYRRPDLYGPLVEGLSAEARDPELEPKVRDLADYHPTL